MNAHISNNNSWANANHYIHNTSTDTLTTLPADIYANDTTATVGLKGQMEQSSQHSPTTPIQPSECGERTGNLLPFSDKTFTITIDSTNLTVTCSNGNLYFSGTVGREISSSNTAWKTNFAFELEAGTYYCNEPSPLGNGFGRYIKKYSDNTNFLLPNNYTFTLSETTKCYLAFYIFNKNLDTQLGLMLNSGSTALPYEPYGYKIPISMGGTTDNVYLGEVQTERQIKKLVLTGEESFVEAGGGGIFRLTLDGYLRESADVPYCTHYEGEAPVEGVSQVHDLHIAFLVSGSGNNYMYIRDDNYTGSASNFKAYLAQQYAAGTPVCVWYVLANPETAVVNEPLRKIGDYADEVSGITIPTIAGANTLSVDTTVQPSEVTVNYKGWHPVSAVHERESGAWT